MNEGFEAVVDVSELFFFCFAGVVGGAGFVAFGNLLVAEFFYFFYVREFTSLRVDVSGGGQGSVLGMGSKPFPGGLVLGDGEGVVLAEFGFVLGFQELVVGLAVG